MKKKKIEERVMRVLAEQFGWDAEDQHRATLASNLVKDFDCDSLDFIEIVMALEEEFDMEIDDGEAEKCKTIGDIVDGLDKVVSLDRIISDEKG